MGGGVGAPAGGHTRAAAARGRGGRRSPVRILRERHDLPGRHARAARRTRAHAGAAQPVSDRPRDGCERRLGAFGHREPAEHARRDLEPRDVRRIPRPHAARRVGRTRAHLRLPAVGVPRGAARAVPRAPGGRTRGARPAARNRRPRDVPAVILWRATVPHLSHPELVWRVVAMSSTFSGNLLLIGSMANLIVAEKAEARGARIGFGEYARVGVPVTLLTLAWGIMVLVATG